MEGNAERECSALGGLFQQIIQDMKNGTPLWEDLVVKATKLHTCLRATIAAISAYLDAFQKIADAATNTRGATKEIGTALTRICLRHKAVEARMKTFSSAIMDCLVVPLQEKIEDWKKAVINLDKEHAKDYKRARAELKKRSTDTLRLQKKARKGCKSGELQRKVESCMQDVTERRFILEETEKKAVRAALIEERSRFCVFVAFLKPVVDEEVAMLSELSHLQEVVDQLEKHTADPYTLPPASEQVIADLKSTDNNWTFTTPPSSPSSLGSRKSSMCSISSLNSSSSGSSKSHHSPNHHYWHRSLSQRPTPPGTLRLSSVSSQDSGFTSQDMLFPRPQVSNMCEHSGGSNASTPAGNNNGALPNPTATWPNLQETLQFERAATAIMNERPHTISTAYERGHQRPALTVYTFHAPEGCQSQPNSPTPVLSPPQNTPRPPIPQRCSSLERPSVPAKSGLPLYSEPAEEHTDSCSTQPMYVNMHELASMAASKAQEMAFPPPPPEAATEPHTDKTEGQEKDGSTSESSLESSSGYGSQTMPGAVDDNTAHTEGYPSGTMRNTLLRRGSMQQQKPPPPIRRTSSISRGVSSVLPGNNSGGGSLEHLPPPPAFLLEGGTARNATGGNANNVAELQRSVASSIAAEIQKRNAMVNVSDYQRTAALGIAAELQRKVAQLSDRGKPAEPIYAERKVIVKESGSGISVAETVRTLTELKHQPASPVSVRRTHSMRSQSCDRRVETGLIATLSAKLAPTLSPRHSRRHSQETGFISAANRANRVRQWIAVRTVPDPTICHDSLMDQIKRGTSLKKTRAVNDRSAPRIH